ncbi:MAG: GNAT family N-acetyltransferase [Actinomycetota bacterium]
MATIRRALPAEVRQLSVTAVQAFHDDPVMRWLIPEDELYFAPGGESMRGAMTSWVDLGEVWCTDDAVAVAVWIPPGRPGTDIEPDPPVDPPPPDRIERIGLIAPLMAEHTPPEEHWYLQLLATHPHWQRQGLGAALMAVIFERADAEGLPCYLETETEENVAYYRRHGFEVRSEWDVPDHGELPGPHMWGMLRPAR